MELPRVNRTYEPVRDQKVNFLVFQKFYLNFAVFLSNFIQIIFNLISFIIKRKFRGEIIRFTTNHCPLSLDTTIPD